MSFQQAFFEELEKAAGEIGRFINHVAPPGAYSQRNPGSDNATFRNKAAKAIRAARSGKAVPVEGNALDRAGLRMVNNVAKKTFTGGTVPYRRTQQMLAANNRIYDSVAKAKGPNFIANSMRTGNTRALGHAAGQVVRAKIKNKIGL